MPYGYEVRFRIKVDHPEKRGPTYPTVPVGHVIPTQWFYSRREDAIRVFERMLEGGEDYSSEFVSRVEVLALNLDRSPDWIRKPVERDRVNALRRAPAKFQREGVKP